MRLTIDWLWFAFILLTPGIAFAHCDIPCGIYSPWIATLAAKTVLTMVQKIKALARPGASAPDADALAYHNTLSRMVRVKEDHAELCKRELQILWSDYFKPEHLKTSPQLHETFWNALKLCSKNKQNIDEPSAKSLQEAVAGIAQMFEKAEAAKQAAAKT